MSVPTRDSHAAAPSREVADRPFTASRRGWPAAARRRAVAAGALLAVAAAVGLSMLHPPATGGSRRRAPLRSRRTGTDLVRDGIGKGILTGLRTDEGAATVVVDRSTPAGEVLGGCLFDLVVEDGPWSSFNTSTWCSRGAGTFVLAQVEPDGTGRPADRHVRCSGSSASEAVRRLSVACQHVAG